MHLALLRSSKENQRFERERGFMKFPGYWVSVDSGRAVLERTAFDETELDPATNWKQAWQNQDGEARWRGYVDLEAALSFAAQMLSAAEGRTLGQAEEELAARFDPNWEGDRCEIRSLSCLLDSTVGGAPTKST
jgi:hypothetical protein